MSATVVDEATFGVTGYLRRKAHSGSWRGEVANKGAHSAGGWFETGAEIAITFGIGGLAKKGLEAVGKKALREVTEEVGEKVVKDAGEKVVIKAGEEGVEKAGKEIVESATQKVGQEAVEVAAEKTGKEVEKELHHLLPKEFSKMFKKAGLDVEDFKILLDKGKHRLKEAFGVHTNIGGNWNKQWRNFQRAYADSPTRAKILEQLKSMRDASGI